MSSFFVLAISNIVGLIGYCFLFFAVFGFDKLWKRLPFLPFLWIAGALLIPPFFSVLLTFTLYKPLNPEKLGTLVGNALFPCYALIPIIIAKLFFERINRFTTFFRQQSLDVKDKANMEFVTGCCTLGTGGCVLPFVLFIVSIFVQESLGMNAFEFNPFMDKIPSILIFGIEVIPALEEFCLLCFFSSSLFCIIWLITFLIKTIHEIKNEYQNNKQSGTFFSFVAILLVISITAILIGLILPGVNAPRYAVRPASCENILKGIAFSLHNYHDRYGSLPPAYTVDSEGKPLHSWRVLVLQCSEFRKVYDKIRLNEPWNSEYNSQFHHFPGDQNSPYCCPKSQRTYREYFSFLFDDPPPTNTDTTRHQCDYSVITNLNTLFPGAESRSLNTLSREELAQTLLVVERPTPVCWMDPTQELTNETKIGSSKHTIPNVMYADGSVHQFGTSDK
jgi:competence protein ComGC